MSWGKLGGGARWYIQDGGAGVALGDRGKKTDRENESEMDREERAAQPKGGRVPSLSQAGEDRPAHSLTPAGISQGYCPPSPALRALVSPPQPPGAICPLAGTLVHCSAGSPHRDRRNPVGSARPGFNIGFASGQLCGFGQIVWSLSFPICQVCGEPCLICCCDPLSTCAQRLPSPGACLPPLSPAPQGHRSWDPSTSPKATPSLFRLVPPRLINPWALMSSFCPAGRDGLLPAQPPHYLH